MRPFLTLLLLLAGPLAAAAGPDAALITRLQGEVTVGSRIAVPFLKLSAGDHLVLKPQATIQLVFFASGQQQAWTGPGVVDITESGGSSPTLTARTTALPPLVVRQLAKTPGAGETGRAGMVIIRGIPTPAKVAKLEQDYAALKQQVAADDLTPEVFYLDGLIELNELERAQAVISMLRARKGDSAAQAVVEHFTPLTQEVAPTP